MRGGGVGSPVPVPGHLTASLTPRRVPCRPGSVAETGASMRDADPTGEAAYDAGVPRLPDEEIARLHRRADELLPLASLLRDGDELPEAWSEALHALADRLGQSYPFADPRYLGQMLKPPHPVAWGAYAMAMLLNPNNHALDGGPATAHLEREAVADVARMLGYDEHLGHLTASGTQANLEALWAARSLRPGEAIVSGENAHYTHARISEVVGARHETLPQTADGALDVDALEARLAAGGVGFVDEFEQQIRETAGTTAVFDGRREHFAVSRRNHDVDNLRRNFGEIGECLGGIHGREHTAATCVQSF